MATLEERVAFLEGRVAEHSHGMDGIRDALVHLEERIDRRFEAPYRFSTVEQLMVDFWSDVRALRGAK